MEWADWITCNVYLFDANKLNAIAPDVSSQRSPLQMNRHGYFVRFFCCCMLYSLDDSTRKSKWKLVARKRDGALDECHGLV